MSYEGKMLAELEMPTRKEVEKALLKILFKHNGVVKEFASGEEIVDEIAQGFNLNERQKTQYLETIYRKENRVKRSLLWHRLLFRAADSLAKEKLVSKPSSTINITNKREWMLTEKGFDEALQLLHIPSSQKETLPIKSFEVQKIVKKLNETPRPENYDPFDKTKKRVTQTKEISIRERGFRQAIMDAYNCKCAFCGLKINSPDGLLWEVQAAHIVPYSYNGKDDIWNGIALCRLHHWAFDVGWLTLEDDYTISVSNYINSISAEYGKIGDLDFIRMFDKKRKQIFLPDRKEIYPHHNSIIWHRENMFYH